MNEPKDGPCPFCGDLLKGPNVDIIIIAHTTRPGRYCRTCGTLSIWHREEWFEWRPGWFHEPPRSHTRPQVAGR